MIRNLLACVALVAITAPAAADTVVVTAARMLDVETGRLLDTPAVVVTDGRIAAIATGTSPRPAVPANAKHIDLPGMTLLPGLIDMHVHVTGEPTITPIRALQRTDTFWMTVGVANVRKMLEAGFTTVRDVGTSEFADVGLKQGIEDGYIVGPRIVPSGYAIGATGGHCDRTEGLPPSFEPIRNPSVADGIEALRAKVRWMHKYGAEVIKFCGTGGVLSRTDTVGAQQFTLDEMRAIVETAHALGLRVAVHAHGTSGINDALRAGADTIEHASLAGAESFRLAKEHGAWFDMDVYNDDYILGQGEKNGLPAESMAKERAIGRKQRETFRAAHAAGVKMLFGTDNGGVFPAGQNALQFATMVQWGMTPTEAIQAATRNASQALDRADVGEIAVGRWGDMIAVAGDPTRDVRLLESVPVVIKGGVVVKGAAAR